MKLDKALMGNSIGGRFPLEDYRLVEFSYKIPINFKINGNKEKIMLKYVSKKYLLERIFKRKKQGYGVPINIWIKKDLKEIILQDYNGFKNSDFGKLFDFKFLNNLFNNIDSLNKFYLYKIWNFYTLILFVKVYDLKVY